MIREFNKKWEQDYLIKTAETLQAVTDRRNTTLFKKQAISKHQIIKASTKKACGQLDMQICNNSTVR